MRWFSLWPGLVLTVLGLIGLIAGAPMPGAFTVIGIGLSWLVLVLFVLRIQSRADQVRVAFTEADPDAARQQKLIQRLQWLQWAFFAFGIVGSVASLPFSGNNTLVPISIVSVGLSAWFLVALAGAFIMANLQMAANQALKRSLGGQEVSPITPLKKYGTGALTVGMILAIAGGVFADEYADLPLKFMPMFWWVIGVMLVVGVVFRIWRQVRRRLPKRQE
jgi:hypothetical protein